MSDQSEKETDDFEYETVYEVYHPEGNHFHGYSSLQIAVTEETEDRIIGEEFSPTHDTPGSRVVAIKENLAGWKERAFELERIKHGRKDSAEDIRNEYERGRIDEDEMEDRLDEVLRDD